MNKFQQQFKEQFLKEMKTKENVVCHSDLDGLLSLAYLINKEKQLKLKGVFDLNCYNKVNKLYTTEKKLNKRKDTFIDLAISNEGVFSLDHHVKLEYLTNNFNPNILHKKANNIKSNLDNFHSKCPLNTMMILVWIYGVNIIETYTYRQRLLIYAADSIYECYRKYKDNFMAWCKGLGMEYILEDLKDVTNDEIEEVKKEIGFKKMGYVHFDYRNMEMVTEYTQVTLQIYIDNICRYMGWEDIDVPKFEYEHEFKKKTASYSEYDELNRKLLFTSAIPYKKREVEVLIYNEVREIKKDSLQTV